MGRKNTIIIGDIIMIGATIGIGATEYIKDTYVYLGVTIALRFVQGIGAAMVQTSCYAIITYVFAENREKYIGMAEAFTGIGLMIGPVFSGFLYEWIGYFLTFLVFSMVLVISGILTLFFAPSSLNKSTIIEEGSQMDERIKKKISYLKILTNRRAVLAYISCSVICIFMSFAAAFLTEVLSGEKGIPTVYNGLILALPCLTYAISSTLVSIIIGNFPRRLFILFAFLLLAVSVFLQGPSEYLGLPDNNAILIVGLGLSGIAQGFIFIPLLPDAIEAVYIKENMIEGQNEGYDQTLNDLSSGLYGFFFSTGQILAPIIGGALNDAVHYRKTCDFMAFACIGYSIFFFIFNIGIFIFRDERRIREKRKALLEMMEANPH